jgi:hypothetical protein
VDFDQNIIRKLIFILSKKKKKVIKTLKWNEK